VVAGGAAIAHYVLRAIRRVKEREAEERASGKTTEEGAGASAALLNGDVVALDIGSTFAKIAYRDNQGKVYMLENREGRHATPAAYQYDADSGLVVGQVAKTQRFMKPDAVASAVHQLLGLKADDEITKKILAHVPFKYADVEGDPTMVGVNLRGTAYSAAQLAEAVARDMYAVAQGKLGSMDGVIGAVSVPLFFNALQKTQYLKACKQAGFEILNPDRIPTDAVAAVSGALQEGLLTTGGKVAVVDVGGRYTQVLLGPWLGAKSVDRKFTTARVRCAAAFGTNRSVW
jgi:molecular chaperone DnaK (HSP70)